MNNETTKSPYTSRFDQVEFGKRIRKVRKSQGLSQKELAKMTDDNREGSYISNFEIGQNATTLDGAVEIANALGVSLDYLCNRDDFVNKVRDTIGIFVDREKILERFNINTIRNQYRIIYCN